MGNVCALATFCLTENNSLNRFIVDAIRWKQYVWPFNKDIMRLKKVISVSFVPGSRCCRWWLPPSPNPSAPANIRGVHRSTRSTVQWPPLSTCPSPRFCATCRGSPWSWHSARGSSARESYGMVRSPVLPDSFFSSDPFSTSSIFHCSEPTLTWVSIHWSCSKTSKQNKITSLTWFLRKHDSVRSAKKLFQFYRKPAQCYRKPVQ